jgi:hypothetical protein
VQSVRDWIAGRTWTLAAFMALLWTGLTYGTQAAIWPARAGWPLLSGALVGGIIYGVGMAFVFRYLQKKYGGKDTARALEKAIKDGRLPEDVEPEIWLPLLERKQRSDQFWASTGPVAFGLFAALEVYLGITEPVVWIWWLNAAIFVFLAVWTPLWVVRRRPRIEALIAVLRAQ